MLGLRIAHAVCGHGTCAFSREPGPSSASFAVRETSAGRCVPTRLQEEKRVAMNKRPKRTLITSQTLIDDADGTLWNVLTSATPRGRTVMHVDTPATELS